MSNNTSSTNRDLDSNSNAQGSNSPPREIHLDHVSPHQAHAAVVTALEQHVRRNRPPIADTATDEAGATGSRSTAALLQAENSRGAENPLGGQRAPGQNTASLASNVFVLRDHDEEDEELNESRLVEEHPLPPFLGETGYLIYNQALHTKLKMEDARSPYIPIPRRTIGNPADAHVKIATPVFCQCRKHSCLKLYCPCFRAGMLCHSKCLFCDREEQDGGNSCRNTNDPAHLEMRHLSVMKSLTDAQYQQHQMEQQQQQRQIRMREDSQEAERAAPPPPPPAAVGDVEKVAVYAAASAISVSPRQKPDERSDQGASTAVFVPATVPKHPSTNTNIATASSSNKYIQLPQQQQQTQALGAAGDTRANSSRQQGQHQYFGPNPGYSSHHYHTHPMYANHYYAAYHHYYQQAQHRGQVPPHYPYPHPSAPTTPGTKRQETEAHLPAPEATKHSISKASQQAQEKEASAVDRDISLLQQPASSSQAKPPAAGDKKTPEPRRNPGEPLKIAPRPAETGQFVVKGGQPVHGDGDEKKPPATLERRQDPEKKLPAAAGFSAEARPGEAGQGQSKAKNGKDNEKSRATRENQPHQCQTDSAPESLEPVAPQETETKKQAGGPPSQPGENGTGAANSQKVAQTKLLSKGQESQQTRESGQYPTGSANPNKPAQSLATQPKVLAKIAPFPPKSQRPANAGPKWAVDLNTKDHVPKTLPVVPNSKLVPIMPYPGSSVSTGGRSQSAQSYRVAIVVPPVVSAPTAAETKEDGKLDPNQVLNQLSKARSCNCVKSLCLKLYCDCFNAGVPCGQDCGCVRCRNLDNPVTRSLREQAQQQKEKSTKSSVELIAEDTASTEIPSLSVPALVDPTKATRCTCLKSKCLKAYCDCFSACVPCGKHCSCIECGNNETQEAEIIRVQSLKKRKAQVDSKIRSRVVGGGRIAQLEMAILHLPGSAAIDAARAAIQRFPQATENLLNLSGSAAVDGARPGIQMFPEAARNSRGSAAINSAWAADQKCPEAAGKSQHLPGSAAMDLAQADVQKCPGSAGNSQHLPGSAAMDPARADVQKCPGPAGNSLHRPGSTAIDAARVDVQKYPDVSGNSNYGPWSTAIDPSAAVQKRPVPSDATKAAAQKKAAAKVPPTPELTQQQQKQQQKHNQSQQPKQLHKASEEQPAASRQSPGQFQMVVNPSQDPLRFMIPGQAVPGNPPINGLAFFIDSDMEQPEPENGDSLNSKDSCGDSFTCPSLRDAKCAALDSVRVTFEEIRRYQDSRNMPGSRTVRTSEEVSPAVRMLLSVEADMEHLSHVVQEAKLQAMARFQKVGEFNNRRKKTKRTAAEAGLDRYAEGSQEAQLICEEELFPDEIESSMTKDQLRELTIRAAQDASLLREAARLLREKTRRLAEKRLKKAKTSQSPWNTATGIRN